MFIKVYKHHKKFTAPRRHDVHLWWWWEHDNGEKRVAYIPISGHRVERMRRRGTVGKTDKGIGILPGQRPNRLLHLSHGRGKVKLLWVMQGFRKDDVSFGPFPALRWPKSWAFPFSLLLARSKERSVLRPKRTERMGCVPFSKGDVALVLVGPKGH